LCARERESESERERAREGEGEREGGREGERARKREKVQKRLKVNGEEKTNVWSALVTWPRSSLSTASCMPGSFIDATLSCVPENKKVTKVIKNYNVISSI